MLVRSATQSDYEQLIRLYSAFVGDDRYSKPDNDSFEQVLNSQSNFVFVAAKAEKLIGFASFSIRFVIRYPTAIAELDELYVAPDYRDHGIGRALMDEVEKTAKEHGCRRVFIESAYKHLAGHKFYVAAGYQNYGYTFLKDL